MVSARHGAHSPWGIISTHSVLAIEAVAATTTVMAITLGGDSSPEPSRRVIGCISQMGRNKNLWECFQGSRWVFFQPLVEAQLGQVFAELPGTSGAQDEHPDTAGPRVQLKLAVSRLP